MKSSKELLPSTGKGIVIDIGTGDGRFVSAAARSNPNKFYIGIDANKKPLEKPSMKATRKPSKGGLQNAMFVQAAIEDLPEELNGVADEIHIHFPWGSLLKAVTLSDKAVLSSLRRISAPACRLEIIIGIDPEKDKTEMTRLGLHNLRVEYFRTDLVPKYAAAGFDLLEFGTMDRAEWSRLETSWARKLGENKDRKVFYLIMRRI